MGGSSNGSSKDGSSNGGSQLTGSVNNIGGSSPGTIFGAIIVTGLVLAGLTALASMLSGGFKLPALPALPNLFPMPAPAPAPAAPANDCPCKDSNK